MWCPKKTMVSCFMVLGVPSPTRRDPHLNSIRMDSAVGATSCDRPHQTILLEWLFEAAWTACPILPAQPFAPGEGDSSDRVYSHIFLRHNRDTCIHLVRNDSAWQFVCCPLEKVGEKMWPSHLHPLSGTPWISSSHPEWICVYLRARGI